MQTDISTSQECPDYSVLNQRTLLTELKNLRNKIILYRIGQVPCALLSALSGAAVILVTIKIIKNRWSPFAYLAPIGLASACPSFAALFLSLENKIILANYNISEISDLLIIMNKHNIKSKEYT